MQNNIWQSWDIEDDIKEILNNSPKVTISTNRSELFDMAINGKKDSFTVEYKVGDKFVPEASVVKCKNGLAINYFEANMRRRDPDCMLIGDEQITDKPTYKSRYNKDFNITRKETFEWLAKEELLVAGIYIGGEQTGMMGMIIAPANAGFFVGGLVDLQGLVDISNIDIAFKPESIIYLAPPFRHTHFKGKQIVVHNRKENIHEIFSYNLYPGPSAKKGIYGVLLQKGEDQEWLTLHSSTVQVVTPYENITTFLHEGASGSGKSEMLEYPHRDEKGSFVLAKSKVTNKAFYININRVCELRPVTDDMAIVNNEASQKSKKLVVSDAENAWFLRVNHITHYGTDPHLEKTCIHSPEPLLFLNIDSSPGSTALIWEHTQDAPGKPCPNPRIILPRKLVPDIVSGEVEIDYRSFGVRTPFCSEKEPSYGIIGMFHILPPTLAWLWRLVSPRGHANPSIIDDGSLQSEGVGSFWPFATGKFINHANLLLKQILATPNTTYILFPNQHIGSWETSFMPQWVSREYFARRGSSKFKEDQLSPSRCPLLGYSPVRVVVEGVQIPDFFFYVERQSEIGKGVYDYGAQLLYKFFQENLTNYLLPELDPIGRKIITCCIEKGTIEDYNSIIPMDFKR
jgi:hypothetical protein